MWEISSQFWASRNAFRAATVARQAGKASAIVTPSGRFVVPTLEGQESRWNARTQRGYLSMYGVKSPTMQTVADGATPLVRRLLAKLAPALTEVYDRELGAVANTALYGWPVSSGYSKSAITLGYSTLGEYEFIGSVGNEAPYVIFIKGGPWNKLVRQPMRQAAINIASTLKVGA